MYFCRLTFGKLRSCFSCGLAPPAGQWQNWLYGCQFENRCQTVYHNVFISPEFIKWKENYFSLRNYLLDINSFYWVAVVSCTFVFVICMPGSLFVLVLKFWDYNVPQTSRLIVNKPFWNIKSYINGFHNIPLHYNAGDMYEVRYEVQIMQVPCSARGIQGPLWTQSLCQRLTPLRDVRREKYK